MLEKITSNMVELEVFSIEIADVLKYGHRL